MRRPVVVLLAFAAVLSAPLMLTPAAAGAPRSQLATSAEEGSPSRLQLVLDASGSMREQTQGGTRLAVAKRALTSVVRDLPADAEAGLRVYGATVDSGPGACTDSQELVAPATDNRAELLRAVRKHQALGETPIGFALREAAEDLGPDGQRTIVLVSDGEPTCDPDPCVVAKELTRQGVALKIDVVGLDVSAAVRDRLRCIAEAGKGTYYDADDAPTLTRSLSQLSTRAFRPFQVDGLPVDGTDGPDGAPVLGAGQYVDEMPGGTMHEGAALHYRVRRTVPGSTVHVGTTLRSPAGLVLTTYVQVSEAEEGLCESSLGQAINLWGARALINASASSWNSDPESTCNTGEMLDIEVAHSDDDMTGQPFELVVYEEPPVTAPASLPQAATGVRWQPMSPPPAPLEVEPGASISDAPALDPGSYDLKILPGETQVFAVPVAWGERLQVQTTVPRRRGGLGDHVGDTAGLYVRVFDPVRRETNPLLRVTGMPRPDSVFQFVQDGEQHQTYAASPPLLYLNRGESDMKSGSLAGLQFVEVNFTGGAVVDDPYLLPYELAVQTFPGPDAAAPAYDDATLSAPPVPAPADLISTAALGEGEPVASAGPSPSASVPADPGPTPARESVSVGKADDGPGAGPWVGAGSVAVVAALAAWLVVRRRRTARTAQ